MKKVLGTEIPMLFDGIAHTPPVEVVLTHPNAKLPEIKTEGSAGYDLVCPHNVVLKHNEPQKVHLGLNLWINDPGLVGMLYIRSSLAKRGVMLLNGAGVIDSDYQDPLACLLQYIGTNYNYTIEAGERIAQLVLTPFVQRHMLQVNQFSDTTTRQGGFGSTGRS